MWFKGDIQLDWIFTLGSTILLYRLLGLLGAVEFSQAFKRMDSTGQFSLNYSDR